MIETIDKICEACRHWFPREDGFVGDCRCPMSQSFEKHCWGTNSCELWEEMPDCEGVQQ
ncbi:MAG: hypothetical protein ACYC6G_19020 [Desulfobaccales bacterium]